MLFAQLYNSIVWIHYDLHVDEITEMFCVNKDKPELMCNGKCYVTKELIDIDIFPSQDNTPVNETNYLPQLKSFLTFGVLNIAPALSLNMLPAEFNFQNPYWESISIAPPFTPPQIS